MDPLTCMLCHMCMMDSLDSPLDPLLVSMATDPFFLTKFLSRGIMLTLVFKSRKSSPGLNAPLPTELPGPAIQIGR